MIKPNGIHHIAIMTADIKAQIAYFTDVLGCKLSAIFDMHGVPGAFHAFVHLNDHSYFSFVQMDIVSTARIQPPLFGVQMVYRISKFITSNLLPKVVKILFLMEWLFVQTVIGKLTTLKSKIREEIFLLLCYWRHSPNRQRNLALNSAVWTKFLPTLIF